VSNAQDSNAQSAIIIGAGIIGAATALALGRAGRKALVIEKLPAAGYGSTGASCAIIRPYYSTVDGSALAYESHFYWRDWAGFLGVEDERGLIRYHDCGCLVLGDRRLQQLISVRFQAGKRAFLIARHQPAVADHVGDHDRR
jgi:sarcosine oxidase subunit beta